MDSVLTEQLGRKTNTALKGFSQLLERAGHRYVPHPARTPAPWGRVAVHTCHGAASWDNVLSGPSLG
jgi:hypothetical protein